MPKAISLFCGAGGCSLGFKRAGYDVVYAQDADKSCVETYKANFPDTIVENKKIENTDFTGVMNMLGVKEGEIDILIGGPPCQGFSTAGTRFWDDPRNHLLKDYVEALKVIRPKWFLMENVEGLLTSKKGEYVYNAIKAFMALGYDVKVHKIYAQEYGVPQRRKRVIVLGNRCSLPFNIPEPQFTATGKIFRQCGISLDMAVAGLPNPTDKKGQVVTTEYGDTEIEQWVSSDSATASDHYSVPLKGDSLERVRLLEPGQTMKDLPEHLQHASFKKRANRRVKDGTPTEKRGGAPSGLKKLFGDEPSLTITSAATREFVHPHKPRLLTMRECARLQTFPDDFEFCGTESAKIKQVGNAIPPMLAFRFAESLRGQFDHECVDDRKGRLLGFELTKAGAMSPALKRTQQLLLSLSNTTKHLTLWDE